MTITIILKLAQQNNPQLLVSGDRFVTDMTGNPHFVGAEVVAQIAVVKVAITSLRGIINMAKYKDQPGDTAKARDTLCREINKLKNMVEYIANGSTVADIDRVNIAHSAGMEVKGYTNPETHIFTVTLGPKSGSLTLTAAGSKNAHEWQYTFDVINYTNRVALPTQTVAHAQIDNLPLKSDVACFHKSIEPGIDNNWDGPIVITVV